MLSRAHLEGRSDAGEAVIDARTFDFIVACFALVGFLLASAGWLWPAAGCMVLVSFLTLWRLAHD